jgi:hypothetical protein
VNDNEQQQEVTQTPAVTEGERTFTQADIDRIVGERAKRAEEAAVKRLLEQLGFDTPDAAKAAVTEAKKRADAEMSELEKLQAKLAETEKAAQAAAERASVSERARLLDKRNGEIMTALKDAEHPKDVLVWLDANYPDDLQAVMSDDGTVDDKAVAKLIAKVKQERPGFFKSAGMGSPSLAGGKPPKPDVETIRKQITFRPKL